MKKVYSKKGFKSGIVFLILAIMSTIMIIFKFNKGSNMQVTKDIVIAILLYLIATNSIYRSFSYSCTEEDEREDDERSKLVELKAQSTSFMICFKICMVINVLLILMYAIKRVELLLYLYIPFGIMSGIMFITIIISTLYYDKKC